MLVSDLLAPIDELEPSLGRLTAAGHEVILFQVLDPKELAFDFHDAVLFPGGHRERARYLFGSGGAAVRITNTWLPGTAKA